MNIPTKCDQVDIKIVWGKINLCGYIIPFNNVDAADKKQVNLK